MSSEAITRNDLKNVINSLLPIFYPVGSYYETSDTTFNPNTEWGGTWELEIAGQVHVSSGSGYTVNGAETNTSDGGSKDAIVVQHNHIQNAHNHTQAAHRHYAANGTNYGFPTYKHDSGAGRAKVETAGGDRYAWIGKSGASSADASGLEWTSSLTTATPTINDKTATNQETGVSGTDKNMPPFIVVNRWHRIG